jgi:hypothetical protein
VGHVELEPGRTGEQTLQALDLALQRTGRIPAGGVERLGRLTEEPGILGVDVERELRSGHALEEPGELLPARGLGAAGGGGEVELEPAHALGEGLDGGTGAEQGVEEDIALEPVPGVVLLLLQVLEAVDRRLGVGHVDDGSDAPVHSLEGPGPETFELLGGRRVAEVDVDIGRRREEDPFAERMASAPGDAGPEGHDPSVGDAEFGRDDPALMEDASLVDVLRGRDGPFQGPRGTRGRHAPGRWASSLKGAVRAQTTRSSWYGLREAEDGSGAMRTNPLVRGRWP